MSNYLNQLVAKSFNLTDTVQPLLFSMFEPIPDAGMVGVADSNWEQQTVTGEKNQLETEWDTWISTIAIEEPSQSILPDLTPASALNSEEILKLAPQLPQVNSEPSPNETLSQPVVIEPATEKVLSNLDRQKLTPAVEVETNLSQATPAVEQNPQPARESSRNPPTIINQVVSTTPQQIVQPYSPIIPPPEDVETLLCVESKPVTSTQRDDDRRQESANQPLPQSAVISPITHNLQSTSTTQPFSNHSITTKTIVPPVSGAPVSQFLPKPESSKLIETHRVVSKTPSQHVMAPNSDIINPSADVETLLGEKTLQITSTQRDDDSRQQLANSLLPQSTLISPITQNIQFSSLTKPLTSAITKETIVPPVVLQQQSKPHLQKPIESHKLLSKTPSQHVMAPNSNIIHPSADVETLLGQETLQITSRQKDDDSRQQLANSLLPQSTQSTLISPITQNIQSSSLTQPKTSAIAKETIVPPISPTEISQQQLKPHSQKLIESPRLVSKNPSQHVMAPNSDIIHPSADVETLLGEKTLQITSTQRDDDSRQQLANPLPPQSTLISPITQNIQSSSLTQPKTSTITKETIVPPVSPTAIPQLQLKPQSQKLIESPRLVSKNLSQHVMAPNLDIIHPSADVETLLGEKTLQITSTQRDDDSRQQLANPLLPQSTQSTQSTLISPITQNIQFSSLTQPKTSAIAKETIVPPVSPAAIPQQQLKPHSQKLIESPRLVSKNPSQHVIAPNSDIIHPSGDVESLLGEETLQITSTRRDDDSRQQLANPLPPQSTQSTLISPITQNIQFSSLTQLKTSAITKETIVPPVVLQQQLKPHLQKPIESHKLLSKTPSQHVMAPKSDVIHPSGNVETLLGEEILQITSRRRDDESRQQLANPLPPQSTQSTQSTLISPITQNIQSSLLTQPKTSAIAKETIVPPISPTEISQQQLKPQSQKLIETHRVVSKTSSQHVMAPNSDIIHPSADVETLLGKKTLQITSTQRDDDSRQQLANSLLPQSIQSTLISPITQNIQSSSLTQPKTSEIAKETIVPPISPTEISQQQLKPHSQKLIESPRLVSKTPSQHVMAPNSDIIHPSADVESLLSEETLQITSIRRDDDSRQQLANSLLPQSTQSTLISAITQNIQSSSLTQPKTSEITKETIASPVVPQQQLKPQSQKLIESPRLVSKTPSQHVMAPNSDIIQPSADVESLLSEETLQITSRQRDDDSTLISPITQNIQSSVLTQPLTSAITKETIVPLANYNIEPPHLLTPKSSKKEFIKINPVASFPQLPEVVSTNLRRLSPLLQNVENLQVTSQKVLPNQDRQPLTSANVQQTDVLLASPLTEPQQKQNNEFFNNQPIKINRVASSSQLQEIEKTNLDIVPSSAQNVKTLDVTSPQDGEMTSQLSLNQPQLLSGEILPATKRVLSMPDRQPLTPANAWETNVPLATPAVVPRQQPATKFLENSPVQINIAPEINTALSNSVPEPQLSVVAPLPQQSFLETSDTPIGSRLEVTRGHGDRLPQRNFYEKQLNEFDMATGLADSKANTATGIIHSLTTAPVVQPLESFASSEQPNSRIQESRASDEELSPSEYAKIIRQSLEKTIDWNDVAGQLSYSAVETSSQKLEHLMGPYLQKKFPNLPTPPNIKISIGRVEIRVTQPPKPATPPARPKPLPMPSSVMSLDEYLSRRAKGGRR